MIDLRKRQAVQWKIEQKLRRAEKKRQRQRAVERRRLAAEAQKEKDRSRGEKPGAA
jgi:hypothetical protein